MNPNPNSNPNVWTVEKAWAWYGAQPWPVGCNFIPSTAINQLEMWQAETFDPVTIERELGWAAGLGFNSVRVYLHDLVWASDARGFRERIDRFLDIAAARGIRPLLVIFDDCWNKIAALGPQPAPRPGVHNSGWVQSPGQAVVNDPSQWGRLEEYVTGLLSAFSDDERILLWDLYNEPGNEGQGEKSLPLLQAVFDWAWRVRPSQPLSVGVWFENPTLNAFQLASSDVTTFHHYKGAADLKAEIERLKGSGRPLICTEYMARGNDSRFETHLPLFKAEGVGCYNWGLVAGKTNTIYPWGSSEGAPEPPLWFHDIFRPDGTPYRAEEVALIRQITGAAAADDDG